MKLFWGSTIFIAVTCFAPLAFGQATTTFINSNPGAGLNSNGNWGDASSWSNGVPSGALNTGSSASVFFYGTIAINNSLLTPQPVIDIPVLGSQSAQALSLEGIGVVPAFPAQGPGTINLDIASGSSLTLTGNNQGATPVVLTVDFGVTANITGGSLSLPTNGIVSVNEVTSDGLVPVLNLSGVSVTTGDNVVMLVGIGSGLSGSITQTNGSSVTTGDNFALDVGFSGASSSAYSLTNNSTLTTGLSGSIIISSGSFVHDATSTLSLGNGSNIYVGFLNGDNGQYNQAGNITLNNSTIIVGAATGASGTFTQTGGNTTGTGSLSIGAGGQGTYVFSGGTADFEQGITVGSSNGNGTLTQSGNTTLTAGAGQLATVGVGGTGLYTLSAGTANFQGGLQVGTLGTVNQSGNSTLTSGSAAIGVVDGTYNLSGGTANFQGGLQIGALGTVTQSLSSTLTVGDSANNAEIDGAYNLNGGTANFQGGILVTSGATVTQTNGTLNAGGTNASEIDGTYTISGGTAVFNRGLLLFNTLNLNGGTVQVAEDQLFNGGGAINLQGGTLKLTSGADTTFNYDYTSGNLVGTSTIDVSATSIGTFTFANALLSNPGGGGISLIGNGNTDFSFASGNTYYGVTSIQGGTLYANQGDVTNSSNLNIGTGGVLTLTLNSGGFAFNGSGGVSGPGLLNVNFGANNDALVLPNTSNFTGNIKLGADGLKHGTLQIYNGTFTDIGEVGTGNSVQIGGTPLAGSPTVPTSGTVILSGNNNTYTGATTISTNFTVKASNFSGSVINNGTLSTLGSQFAPANMSITGNLTSIGVITVFTNGVNSDMYGVSGGATLSGVVSVKGSGTKQYAAVTTGSGVTIGGNTNLNDPGGLTTNAATALFSSYLSLDPTNKILYVNTVQNSLAGFATTPNQRAVATVLDPLTQTPPPLFVPLLTNLNSLSASEIPAALEELTPESLQYPRNIAFENATFMVQKVNGVLSDIRAGYTGLDANGLSYSPAGFNSALAKSLDGLLASNAPNFHTSAPNGVNYYPDGSGNSPAPYSDYDEPAPRHSHMTSAEAATPTTYDGQVLSDSPIPMRTSESPTLRTSQFTEFVSGDVILSDINQNQNMPSKASYTAGDIMAGVGFRVASNFTMGVLFDYNHTNAKTDSNGSKTNVDSYSPGIFATYYKNDFYVNGLFSFGYNQYYNTRSVPIAGGSATSNTNGQQYVGDIDFGYNFHPAKNLVVTPTLGLTYTHLDVDAFSETGLPAADLNVNSQSVDSFRSRLGGQVQYLVHAGNMVLQPNLTAMWQHEYLDDGPGITSNFQAYGTGPFTIQTVAPTRDSALLGAGLTATLNNSLCFYLNYTADVGGGDYLAQSIVGGVKASF